MLGCGIRAALIKFELAALGHRTSTMLIIDAVSLTAFPTGEGEKEMTSCFLTLLYYNFYSFLPPSGLNVEADHSILDATGFYPDGSALLVAGILFLDDVYINFYCFFSSSHCSTCLAHCYQEPFKYSSIC